MNAPLPPDQLGFIAWTIDLAELPALFAVLDDQGFAVELRVAHGGAVLATRSSDLICRHDGQRLVLHGPESSLRIDLDRLTAARVVSRPVGRSRCLSLELLGLDRAPLLTVSGPCLGHEEGGEIWSLLLEALARPESGYASVALDSGMAGGGGPPR